jgi:hypothetical protein
MIKNKLSRLKKKGEPQKKRLGIKLIRINKKYSIRKKW